MGKTPPPSPTSKNDVDAAEEVLVDLLPTSQETVVNIIIIKDVKHKILFLEM